MKIPRFENRETWGTPLAERLIVTLASFHCALRSPFFRCTSLLLPSLFVHSQDEQGGDIEEAAKGLDDATGEAQERRNQRDAPAGRLKQIIKESCDSDLAGHFDQVDRETQLKKAPVRQYVGRRSRGVAVYNQPAADETLSEYSRQYGEEIKHTGNPGLETRRRFRHCSGSHVRSPLREKLGSTDRN